MLLAVWMLAFFVFDRLIIWKVRPGQLSRSASSVGAHAATTPAVFALRSEGQDFFHDIILGLGAGDLLLTTSKETIHIPNVLLVDRKVRAIEKLIVVKPDQIAAETVATKTPMG